MGIQYGVGKTCFIQVNKLDCDGVPLTGTGNSLVLCCVASYKATAVAEDSDDVEGTCHTYPGSSEIKRYDFEWDLGENVDWELLVMLGTHNPLFDAQGNMIGVSPICGSSSSACSPACNDTGCSNAGVSLMGFNQAVCGDKILPQFAVDIFPRLTFTLEAHEISRSGKEVDFDAGVILTGKTRSNNNWGFGPGDIWTGEDALSGCVVNTLSDMAPESCDCDVCDWEADRSSIAVGG